MCSWSNLYTSISACVLVCFPWDNSPYRNRLGTLSPFIQTTWLRHRNRRWITRDYTGKLTAFVDINVIHVYLPLDTHYATETLSVKLPQPFHASGEQPRFHYHMTMMIHKYMTKKTAGYSFQNIHVCQLQVANPCCRRTPRHISVSSTSTVPTYGWDCNYAGRSKVRVSEREEAWWSTVWIRPIH